ncbi:hypothetical protein [Fredinandcohnia quinoae]|uniref:Uncharacterized protein n=1 Tax=Fredinandcohnia quinoae TaxID=2918902 RepID=A0AAW5E5W8_9BACI|nr:hypothetical protein [Fredinandcohnia sp. SECRCQ15]MCH1625371.1 hypothetical protein [Fredinandcohnia sp. SECRCQ15]
MSNYTPSVTEGIYPEDAGWTVEKGNNVLLLSIPVLTEIMTYHIYTFDYTWLYHEELDAYIFCFRLQNDKEFAILFQKDHAGMLLMEGEAYEEFTLVITDQDFKKLNDDSKYITLSNISLDRQKIAGW